VGLGGPLELEEHLRADLGGAVLLPVDVDAGVAVGPLDHLVGDALGLLAHLAVAAPHEALDAVDGLLGVGDGLALGHLADEPLAVLGVAHHGGRDARPLLVRDDDGVLAVHDRDDGVGGAEVDADDLAHGSLTLLVWAEPKYPWGPVKRLD